MAVVEACGGALVVAAADPEPDALEDGAAGGQLAPPMQWQVGGNAQWPVTGFVIEQIEGPTRINL